MITVCNAQVISAAWTDVLQSFVECTRNELLIMSPWITTAAARLISYGLSSVGPVAVRILARLDESDFLSGASHLAAFDPGTYPSAAQPEFRALPLLHGKMLLGDRERIVIGSANLTDGGLYRNHEMCLALHSTEIGAECAQAFERYWRIASPLPPDYLANLEATMAQASPQTDEENSGQPASTRGTRPTRERRLALFKYTKPSHAAKARSHLSALPALSPPQEIPPEDSEAALSWLTGALRFLPREQRASESVTQRVARLFYHPDVSVRATAIDRAGRNGFRSLLPRMQALAGSGTEPMQVRSAAAYSLGLLGSPEAFPTLAALSSHEGDVGRWARRGCFLLLDSTNDEDRIWFLREAGVADPMLAVDLARRCEMDSGTVSERMTKALIVEKRALGAWSEPEIEALTSVMVLVSALLAGSAHRIELSTIARETARVLGVAPGDLRHGPLSPSLLSGIASSGLSDHGLGSLLSPLWSRLEGSKSAAREVLMAAPRYASVLAVIESHQDADRDDGRDAKA
jgi:hypothetical protein